MKQELIQLLQHEDESNVLLGCFMAYHDGVDLVDIFSKLIDKDGSNYIYQYKVLEYELLIGYKIGDDGEDVFMIYHYKLGSLHRIEIHPDDKNYKQIENEYQRAFMEYVLGLKQ